MKKYKKYIPLILTAFIAVVDQITKSWVVANIPLMSIYKVIGNDLVWILHIRNTGAAFSMGADSSVFFRVVVFLVLPIALMVFLWWFGFSKKSTCTGFQRWCVAGILGGGIGTLIDRVFRFNEGVVDFISVKFFGIFGLDRWPTFNVSDSSVVVFVILLAISILFTKDSDKK